MSITAILVILGCLVAGYWIVSSIMGPGLDVTDEAHQVEARKAAPRKTTPTTLPAPSARTTAPRGTSDAPMSDWYIVLDVPQDASRAEIQAAAKRRLAQAEAVGDQTAVARINRAATTGLSGAGRPRP